MSAAEQSELEVTIRMTEPFGTTLCLSQEDLANDRLLMGYVLNDFQMRLECEPFEVQVGEGEPWCDIDRHPLILAAKKQLKDAPEASAGGEGQ